ncbi:MAG: hypothetical protein O3A87_03395 [Verrucomicrobia bacterium]|nr:hypothetical protein [Verrucomicrobiota bacterium]MDA1005508.1 hypothetical protein [Verrucomicrobiota bacterium]
MPIFKLTLVTLFARKAWFFVLFAAILLPLTLPYLTPHETNIRLLEPARAQVAWSVAWFVAILWTFSSAARLGEANARTGLGAYFRSRGVGRFRQMLEIWLGCMVYLLPLVAVTVAVCLTTAMPQMDGEASMWVTTNLQFALLFLLAVAPLALLCIALGSRFGAMVGYVVPLTLCLYGLYGVNYLGMMIRLPGENALLEWIYAVSPHYHLADLTPRLVFKLGSLPTETFGTLLTYFLGVTLVVATCSTTLFRTEPLKA